MRAHSTFGQHRGQCSPAFRAAGVVWERLFSDRSASVGHCPLCCPSVVASTAFPYLQTRRPKPQPHARREGGSGGLLVVAVGGCEGGRYWLVTMGLAPAKNLPPRVSLFPPSPPYSALSRVKMNSVPTPSVLITLMFWLWALIISLTIDSPSPVPLRSFPREASIL